jgi:UDP-N-acetylglucosamine transferase subunit ALG13
VIFVTVGNAKQRFRRILDAVDALTGNGFFGSEQVFIQTGHNTAFRPLHCDYKPFLPMNEFQQLLEKSDLIICHGGCTVISVIRLGKVPVVIPRRKKYGEHVNDHQMQLVAVLASEELVVQAYEPEDLPQAITEARRRSGHPRPPSPSQMIVLIAKAIEELIGK